MPSPKRTEPWADQLLPRLSELVGTSTAIDGANLYVSLHAMGGRGGTNSDDTAYSWRDRPYLTQVQAWWFGEANDKPCLDWVERLRIGIADVSEGAFISFPDEHQHVTDYYDPVRLERLRGVKRAVDPAGRLRFPLGLLEVSISNR